MKKLKTTIGLEIHAQLKTRAKMFCSCSNLSKKAKSNSKVCAVCLGYPGALPAINEKAVKKVIRAGKALDCEIADFSRFDRKNYFYPDLPKGYQISQHEFPLCKNGKLKINGKEIGINRIHLEEDTGSLIHEGGVSLIDFNRSGVPLMELVTEPDISSGREAKEFAEELRLILRYLDVSDADMEKGQMRVEVNISLAEDGEDLGTKVEIKNLNSFKVVEQAVDYEIKRQTEVLESGGEISQETRGWREGSQKTVSQRAKEEAHDYRYFPEPDLPPLDLSKAPFKKEEITLGSELPQNRRERFKKEYKIEEELFITDKSLGDYFEKVVSEGLDWLKTKEKELGKEEREELISLCCNYILSDLQGLLEGSSVESDDFKTTPENFAELIVLLHTEEISSKIAKRVLKEMFKTGGDPSQIIEEQDLKQVKDEGKLEKIIEEVMSENKQAVEDFKSGKEEAKQFLIGQVMAKTRGKADPGAVNKIISNKFN